MTLIIAGVLTLPLQAATITVADAEADYSSIQAAIDAANNGDEIIVSPGTYQKNIDFWAKAITVRSASGGPADTIIDGDGSSRTVVTCARGETSTTVLDGFTIINTNGFAYTGGGMYNEDSSPTVTNCTFCDNTAKDNGGGMFNYDSSPTVTNCILWDDSPDEILIPTLPRLRSVTVTFRGLPSDTVDGGGNIAVDPLFVDAKGPDNIVGTEDDNLSLSGGSPCIDSGSFFDFNNLFDLGANDRYVDDLTTINTGSGVLTFLDMGAYEFQPPTCLPGDHNCDGIVNLLDLSLLALHWMETN